MLPRVKRLYPRIAGAGLDGLLVTERVNRFYVSGFSGSLGWAVIAPAHHTLVVDGRYATQAPAQAPGWEIRRVEHHAFFDGTAAAEAVRGLAIRRLGFEADKVTVAQHDAIARALPGIALVPASGHVEVVRRRKEPDEIAAIERACAIAERALDAALPLLRPGVTERQLAWELEKACRDGGANAMAFCLVGAGPRSALPHAAPTDRALADGDLVLVDIGPIVRGYYADITRMFVIGAIEAWQAEIHRIALEAQARALAACRAGATTGDLDAAARDYIDRAGYGEQFLHLLGHGVGLQGSGEGPLIDRGGRDVLEADMIVTIEPGIYLAGRGGVRVEETVLVTPDGCRALTHYPHSLTPGHLL
jgi:Xaa-Pro aminopeptidase